MTACPPLIRFAACLALIAGCAAPAPLQEDREEVLAVSNWQLEGGRPRPTSDLLGDVWAEDNGVDRKQWLAEMHGVSPDIDWRAIERENARSEHARRLGLTAADEPPGRWTEVGSSNQAGHTRCATVGPANADGQRYLYVGSANGGLWRGRLDGQDWQPISDDLFGGVDEVVALPGRAGGPDQVLLRRGRLLFFSEDSGTTWSQTPGFEEVTRIHRVLRRPGTDEVLALVDRSGACALWLSTDGGATFRSLWAGAVAADADLWVARSGARRGEELWVAFDGQLHRSLDGGKRFTPGPRIPGNVTGVHLRGSEAGGPTLYCAARVDGRWRLYRASTPTKLEERSLLPDFWGNIIALPHDPDVVLVGGIEAHRSEDGGATFEKVNTWGQYYGDPARSLHADVRGMVSLPDPAREGRDLCLVSTDGGTYASTDRGRTFRNLCLNGLGVAQVYSTLTSKQDPTLVLCGTQDQGYQRGHVRPSTTPGPSTPFDQLLSGDYGYLTSSDGEHDLVYSSYPGFVLVQEGAADPELLYPWVDFPERARHAWMPPIVADPTDARCFYLLADRLYRYRRREGPYWAYKPHSAQEFTAGGGSFLTAMDIAPSDATRMVVANDAGRLWASSDGGETWRAGKARGAEHLRPTCLEIDPNDPRRVVVGGSGYSAAAVWISVDGGAQWQPHGEGLPRTLVLGLAWSAGGDLYAATEAGAWWLPAGEVRWLNLMGSRAPATTYWSVERLGDGRMRFGTYGRGIWDYTRLPQPEGHVPR
ncbi:MAG: hypothetical protein O2816_01780 [Planctomycetota bacterium]|nr:hypothetical protein [Planctomycetota bacterium]